MAGRYVFDIEANGLFRQFNIIHCIRAYDIDKKIMHRFDEFNEPIFRGIALLNEAEILIGHNIINFDVPALWKYSKSFTNYKTIKTFDTLLASKLVMTDLDKSDLGRIKAGYLPKDQYKKHSLKSWGLRLGEHKGEYGVRYKGETDEGYMDRVWARGCKEMYDYCEQDVMTNYKLYQFLLEQMEKKKTPDEAFRIEQEFAKIISRQERNGAVMDVEKAETLEEELRLESAKALDEIHKNYTPKYFGKAVPKAQVHYLGLPASFAREIVPQCQRLEEDDDIVFKHPTSVKFYKKGKSLYQRCKKAKTNRRKKMLVNVKMRDADGVVILDADENEVWTTKEIMTTNVVKDAVWTDIDLVPFNPNSGTHVIRWLKDMFNWKPTEFTKKGNPKTDAESLENLTYKGIETLQRYQMLDKRLSQLADGKTALLKCVDKETNRIYGRCDTLGAVSRRCTHNSPNMAQIPAGRKPYGKEFRELITVPQGYKLVGADGSGLELRTLSHYLTPFDNGRYAKIVLDGDIHWQNCQDAGFIEAGTVRDEHDDDHEKARGFAKTFIYAFLYGAGAQKLGGITNPNDDGQTQERAGRSIKSRFMASNPAIKNLTNEVKKFAKKYGYVLDLNGNKLWIRSEHSALNLLLQSCGAIVMKYWLVEADRVLQEMGLENSDDVRHVNRPYDYEMALNVHDEAQLEVRDEIADRVAKVLAESFPVAGEDLNMRIKIEGEAKIGMSWKDTH